MTDSENTRILGLGSLVALVFGPMIGAGIFNIAQNMAVGASAGAVIVSWGITAVGMLSLVFTFKTLADTRPDLHEGIYQYAEAGFGRLPGFAMAWGYWLCASFGNVAYAVMLNDALGAFFPVLLRHGWATVAFSSVLIWSMFLLVASGIRWANMVNRTITAIKFLALIVVAVLLLVSFNEGLFTADFWGNAHLGGMGEQVRSTMLVTLWCFLGIEGAAMMSARARRASDVGRAGVIGFFCALLLYALISLLCFGVMSQAELADLHDPSVAYVLRAACGPWAYYFVVVSVIVALLGGSVAWFLICAQTAYGAACAGVFPRRFLATNRHGVPTYGLLVACVVMQVFLLMVVMASQVYLAAVNVATMMVLPAYLFCGLFLWKASRHPAQMLGRHRRRFALRCRVVGIASTAYCLWLIYAGGLDLLLATSVLYLCGLGYYRQACRERGEARAFTTRERVAVGALIVAAMVAAGLVGVGVIRL